MNIIEILFSGWPFSFTWGISLTIFERIEEWRVWKWEMLSDNLSFAISHALPNPTILATFSVPERIPFSWPPPSIMASTAKPFLINNAPTPFGPLILCEEIDYASAPNSSTLIGILPTACTASVCNGIWYFLQISDISLMGCIVPTSLFANMILTRTVCEFIELAM